MKHTQMLRRYRHAMRALRWQKLQRFRASPHYKFARGYARALRTWYRMHPDLRAS